MIRFIEIINETNFNPRMERTSTPRFRLGEVWVNEQHVVSVREAPGYKSLLREGLLPSGLEQTHSFASIIINEGGTTQTHVVVGSTQHVATQLSRSNNQLLKG